MHQISYEKYMRDEQFKPLTQYIKETPIMGNIMTDEARLVIRAIIIELYFLHKTGKCPQHLEETNVFIREDGIAELRDCNLDDKSDSKVFENYQDVHKIIVETVFQQHKDIPKDMKHLLNLMNTPDKVVSMELEYLICTHASLVPLRNRETFFLWMYRHIMFMLPCDKPAGDMPYKSYWHKKLKGDDLKKLFRCERDIYYKKKITTDYKKEITTDFLKSYRNAIVHCMDKYSKEKIRYTPDDIQLILCVTFPMLLPKMQVKLWENKQLEHLQLDSLFGSNLDNEFSVIMDPSAVSNHNKSKDFTFQVGSMPISANQDMKRNDIDVDLLPTKEGVVFPFRNMHHVSYVEYIRNLEFKPLIEYMKQTPVLLVGPTRQRARYLITEEAKFVIRALLKELYFLHKRGKCPRNFNESNVFIREDGIVQLRGCKLDDKSDSTVSENYKDAQNIIKIVFGQHKKDIPEDMMHLLNLMNTDKVITMELEYFICTHASLVPLRNRETFFLWMYLHIMFVLSCDKSTEKDDIINALRKLDWGDKLQGNSLLGKIFQRKRDGPEDEIDYFLNSYRDTLFHGMDECYTDTKRYTPDDIQLILWFTFPMLLPTMQQELWKKNQLRDMKLDGLFGSTVQNVFDVTSCFRWQ